MKNLKLSDNSEIYMDNAATSYPKPPEVMEAVSHFGTYIGASAGRGAYPKAIQTGEMIYETRSLLAKLLGVPDPNRIIFTFNASDGLNIAIHGINWQPGDRAVISGIEHNSVLRPLDHLVKVKG
ncbi:MAG: aminotransferase class V-fold PLP-dependent enzyme, partial [bacterium]